MFFLSSPGRANRTAQSLRSELAVIGINLSYKECQDAVARMYGHYDYDALIDTIGKEPASADDMDSDDATVELRRGMHMRVVRELGADPDQEVAVVDIVGPTRGKARREPVLLTMPAQLREEAYGIAAACIEGELPMLRGALQTRPDKGAALKPGGPISWLFGMPLRSDADCPLFDELYDLHDSGLTMVDLVDVLLAQIVDQTREAQANGQINPRKAFEILSAIPSKRARRGAHHDLKGLSEAISNGCLDVEPFIRVSHGDPIATIAELIDFSQTCISDGTTLVDFANRFAESRMFPTKDSQARAAEVRAGGGAIMKIMSLLAPGHRVVPVSEDEIEEALIVSTWRTFDRGVCGEIAAAFDKFSACGSGPDGKPESVAALLASAHLQGATLGDLIYLLPALRATFSGRSVVIDRDLRGGPWPYLISAAHALDLVSVVDSEVVEADAALRLAAGHGFSLADIAVQAVVLRAMDEVMVGLEGRYSGEDAVGGVEDDELAEG